MHRLKFLNSISFNTIRKASAYALVLVCGSFAHLAEVDLTEFVEVDSEKFVHPTLGFSIDYPYELSPRDYAEFQTDFYVSWSYSLPAVFVKVIDVRDDVDTKSATRGLFQELRPDWKLSEATSRANLDGSTYEAEVKWVAPVGDGVKIKTRIFAERQDDRLYVLCASELDVPPTPLAERVQNMIDSFTIVGQR